MKLLLLELAATAHSTLSLLTLPSGREFFVLEDGCRLFKVPGDTRIPAGTYELEKNDYTEHAKKVMARLGVEYVLQLCNVPHFDGIQMHDGNDVDDTDGCLLIGTNGVIDSTGHWSLTESRRATRLAYREIIPALNSGDVHIEIVRTTSCSSLANDSTVLEEEE